MKIRRLTIGMFATVIAILSMSFAAVQAEETRLSLRSSLNASMRISTISGTVTNRDGEPLAGIRVNAEPVQAVDYDYANAITDENGAYTLTAPVGVYRLNYYDESGAYINTWYGGATWSDAAELPVPGTDVTGIDVVMSRGGTVSGTLAFADGMEQGNNTNLELLKLFDDGAYWSSMSWTDTETNDWTFAQVPAGTYRICAYNYGDDSSSTNTVYQCYGGTTPDEATDIIIGEEESLDGIVLTFTPPPYTITGTVTDDNGELLGGIQIYGYQTDSNGYGIPPQGITNDDGTYTLAVNSGTYSINFNDYSGNNRYDSAFANDIVVDGANVTVDVVMPKNYGVAGTLILEDGSTPHEASLTAYQWREDGGEGGWMYASSTYIYQTDAYFIPSFQPGTYRVCAYTYDEAYNMSDQSCYGGGSDPVEGTDVVVVDGADTTGIDINVGNIKVGTITGVVTDEDGNPIEGIQVSASFDWGSNPDSTHSGYGSDTTAADGSFEMTVSPGTYIVHLNDYNGNYLSETYDGKAPYIYEGFTPVSVVDGETVTITAALQTASKLLGTITLDGDEVGYGSVEVKTFNAEQGWYDTAGWGDITPGGTYTATGLSGGTYRICYWFAIGTVGDSNYGSRSHYGCYDGVSTPEEGTDVVIGDGETVLFDMMLEAVDYEPEIPVIVPEHNGVITGTVTNWSGEAVPNIKVQLYKAYDGYDYPGMPSTQTDYVFNGAYEVVYTFTDENGAYKIGSLPDGTYHVGFSDETGVYAYRFYDRRVELRNSTPVKIEGGATVTNINSKLAVAGQLSGIVGLGTITNTSENVQLSLMNIAQNEVAWESPSADGSYLFEGLPSGEYILYAYTWDGNYRDEYYEDARLIEEATIINVVAGQMTEIDFVLNAPADPLITSSNPDMMWVDPWTGEINLFIDPWMPETVLTAESTCPEGTEATAATLIIGWEWDEFSNNQFEMTQNDDGTWSATIETDEWLEGNVTINWTCGDEIVVQEVGSSMLYDPSGTIVDDVTGAPIEGATVTLYQLPNALPDTADEERNCRSVETITGSWMDEPVAAFDAGVVASVDTTRSQPTFLPAVPTQMTAEDGVFGWEVAEGCWYVVASAPGYESSTSPVVGVPPEVTGLLIQLTPNETVPTAVTVANVEAVPTTVTVTMMIVLSMLASGVLVVNRKK